ncbi:MAG: hypothetical protein JWN86_2237 [Planctomycetota bacterium]|nr:hypothetical protein [Planctomycetota bacterium]
MTQRTGIMKAEELRSIGEKLFGPRWQTMMARALPVNPRTVRKWLAGKRQISPLAAARIRSIHEEEVDI